MYQINFNYITTTCHVTHFEAFFDQLDLASNYSNQGWHGNMKCQQV